MIKATIKQGKYRPDLETFEEEFSVPISFEELADAIDFSRRIVLFSKPERIASSFYDLDHGKWVQYETVRVNRIELWAEDEELAQMLDELKKSQCE